jgi:hypothetical protein
MAEMPSKRLPYIAWEMHSPVGGIVMGCSICSAKRA